MAPELFIALVGIAVFAGIVLFAWFYTADAARSDAFPAKRARLQQQAAWLQSRLLLAQREGWDPEMSQRLSTQLTATRTQLALLRADDVCSFT